MTKIHEQFYYGDASKVLNELKSGSAKGEFTIVIKLKEVKEKKSISMLIFLKSNSSILKLN
nr:hypothetical protein [Mycoplasmopsis agalactiae]